MSQQSIPPLTQASDDIKLAVDLIEILENSQLATDTILKALAIVTEDFQQKS